MSATLNRMKVNANRDVASATQLQPRRKTQSNKPASENVNFAASAQLAQALSDTPAVRPDAVARAKALIANPNYPNADVVQKVARTLVNEISSPEKES